ncbi:MAG TPA: hypothetical protein VEW03_09295 [Longimicrobiaceae bacterium]|nr:hypothetical protein [Longimicrobiaceae bacterium]
MFSVICPFSSHVEAQRPMRLYGVIDIDYFGYDVAFSLDMGRDTTVTYYGWGRDLDEIEGMAIDGEGELYLFSESGVVKKVDLDQPDRPPVRVAQGRGYNFAGADTRASDGMIELYDEARRRLVTFDPRTDSFVGTARGVQGPVLSGLARTGTQLYGTATTGDNTALYVYRNGVFTSPACATLLRDVQAIERYTDTALIIARISITDANEIMLTVETLEPGSCSLRRVVRIELDKAPLRPFLKPSYTLEQVLREARRRRRNPEIEALTLIR